MIVYGVIDSRDAPGKHPLGDVLDLYLERQAAEQALRAIIGDEPEWEPFLSLVEIELATSSPN